MSQKPIDSVRVGAVSANIFKNERKDGGEPFYSASVTKSYKDQKSGEWQQTSSFGKRDLDSLSQVITVARAQIETHEQRDRSNGPDKTDAAPKRPRGGR